MKYADTISSNGYFCKEQPEIGGYFFTEKKKLSFFSKPMQEMQERPNENIIEIDVFRFGLFHDFDATEPVKHQTDGKEKLPMGE